MINDTIQQEGVMKIQVGTVICASKKQSLEMGVEK